MKNIIALTLLLIGCGPRFELEEDFSESESFETADQKDQSEETYIELKVKEEICIDTDAEFDDISEFSRDTLKKVVARWGHKATFDDKPDCIKVGVGEVFNKENKPVPASFEPDNIGTEGNPFWMSGSFENYTSYILINRNYLNSNRIIDTSAEVCEKYNCYNLASILTHEFGHVFGLSHSDNEESPMFKKARVGYDPFPTEEDLENIWEPGETVKIILPERLR